MTYKFQSRKRKVSSRITPATYMYGRGETGEDEQIHRKRKPWPTRRQHCQEENNTIKPHVRQASKG